MAEVERVVRLSSSQITDAVWEYVQHHELYRHPSGYELRVSIDLRANIVDKDITAEVTITPKPQRTPDLEPAPKVSEAEPRPIVNFENLGLLGLVVALLAFFLWFFDEVSSVG